ncbi:MAG: helix-turn-helix domain-containing protein, partial [Nanoarchaeota archaeon]
MKDKVSEVLKSIGLNKNEIEIYIDLIGHKSSTALEISKRTKI